MIGYKYVEVHASKDGGESWECSDEHVPITKEAYRAWCYGNFIGVKAQCGLMGTTLDVRGGEFFDPDNPKNRWRVISK